MSTKKIKNMKPAALEDFFTCCKLKLKIKLLSQAGTQCTTTMMDEGDDKHFSIVPPKDTTEDLGQFLSGTVLGTIFHHDKIIAITFKVISFNKNKITCEIPMDIFEIDSRQNERLVIDTYNTAVLKVNFTIDNENHMHPKAFQLYDISSQGFSILTGPEDAYLFKPNEVFKIVNLKILGTQITFSAEAKNIYFLPEKKGILKVGLRITKIQASHEILLNKYLEKRKEAHKMMAQAV